MIALLAVALPQAATVVSLAAVVYGILQTIKKLFPSVGGPLAVVLNIVFSVAGYVAAVQPADLFSLATLVGIVSVVGTAAGIHGAVTAVGGTK